MRIDAHRFLAFILLLLTFCLKTLGCTLVVVAGSATDDGRPLLFKNRDSSNAYMVEMRIEQNSGFICFKSIKKNHRIQYYTY